MLTKPTPSHREVQAVARVMDMPTLPDQGPATGSPRTAGLPPLQRLEPVKQRPEWRRLFDPISPEMRNMFRRKPCLLAVALGASGTGWKGGPRPSVWALVGRASVLCGRVGPRPGWPNTPQPAGPLQKAQELWELGGWWAALSCSSLGVEHLARRVYSVPRCTQEACSCRGSGFIYGRQEASEWGSCCSPLLPGTRLSPCSLAS